MSSFGPTVHIHHKSMAYLWGPVINITIIMALYSYRVYAIAFHAIVAFTVSIFTLAVTFPIMTNAGFPPPKIAPLYDHVILGFVCLLIIMLQVILGIFMKVGNIFDFSSNVIHKLNLVHKILGYITVILCKANYMVIFNIRNLDAEYWGFLGMDLAVAAIIIIRKIVFPKLAAYPSSKVLAEETQLQEIESLKQLDQTKSYLIFSNRVYDIEDLKFIHPVGMQVILSVRNRDIDRFLYGMYSSEAHPELNPHSHSFRSLKLLNSPLAKVSIPQVFSGIAEDISVKV